MKKNLFSFKSSLLALMPLISVGAYADSKIAMDAKAGKLDNIWVASPDTIAVGDTVTFVNLANKKIYNGYQLATGFTGLFPRNEGVNFVVAKGFDYDKSKAISFVAKDSATVNGKKVPQYLDWQGAVATNEMKPEISWNLAKGPEGSNEGYVRSATSPNKYFYFDEASQYFKTTDDPTTVGFYKMAKVYMPELVDTTAQDSIVRVYLGTDGKIVPNSSIQLKSKTEGASIMYRLGTTANATTTTTTWTDWTKTDDGKVLLTEPGKNIIEAVSVYGLGQTDVVTFVANVARQDNPYYTLPEKISAEGKYEIVITDSTTTNDWKSVYGQALASVKVYATKKGTKTPSVFTTTISSLSNHVAKFDLVQLLADNNWTASDILAGKYIVESTLKATKDVDAISTLEKDKNGFSLTVKSDTITLTPYKTSADVFGTIVADPKQTDELFVTSSDQSKTFKFDYLNWTSTSNGAGLLIDGWEVTDRQGAQVTLKFDDATVSVVNVTLTNDGEFTLPVNDTYFLGASKDGKRYVKPFTAKVAAKVFAADNNADASSVKINTVYSPATQVIYNPSFKSYAFTTDEKTYYINVDSAKYNAGKTFDVEMKIYPSNGNREENVFFFGGAGSAEVTGSQNNNVGGAVITKVSGENNTYNVSFNKEAIDNYFKDADVQEKGYMVSFLADSLYTDNFNGGTLKVNNSNTVTAYIKFYEPTTYLIDVVDTLICEEQTSINLSVKGEGKFSKKIFPVKVKDGSKATVKGTAMVGGSINNSYDIAATKDPYVFTVGKLVLKQDNGTSYDVTLPKSAFTAHENDSLAADTTFEKVLDVRAHVEFAVDAKSYIFKQDTLFFDVKATTAIKDETIDDNLSIAKAFGTEDPADSILVKIAEFGKDAVEMKAKLVPNTTSNVMTFGVKMNNQLTADQYVVSVADSTFKANLDYIALKNDTIGFYVTYYVEDKPQYICTSVDSIYVNLYGVKADKDGTRVKAGDILYASIDGAQNNLKKCAAFNNGRTSYFPTVVNKGASKTADGKDATLFLVSWKGNNVEQNRYQINFPANTVSTKINDANDAKLLVNFEVANHIDIALTKSYAQANLDLVPVRVHVFDTVDSLNAGVNLKVVPGTNITFDGTEYPVDSKKDSVLYIKPGKKFNYGTYKVSIPAKALIALADTTHADLVGEVELLDLQFVLNDTVCSEVENAGLEWCKNPTVRVHTILNGEERNDIKVTTGAPAQDWGSLFTKKDNEVAGVANAVDANNLIAITPNASTRLNSKDSAYKLEVYANRFNATVNGVYFTNPEAVSCEIVVDRHFHFVNNVNGISTLNTDLPDVAEDSVDVLYTQNFDYTKEPIALPFDVKVADLGSNVEKVQKINFAFVEGTTEYFYLTDMKDTDTMYANKPYIISVYSKTGVEEVKFHVNTLKQATQTNVYCATTNDVITFYNAFDANGDLAQTGVNPYRYYLSDKEKAYKVNYTMASGNIAYWNETSSSKLNSVRIWRWYGLSNSKGIDYAKFVEGDFDVTGISNVNAENANDAIYNVAGQRINSVKKNQIVISNGKKMVVK